MPRASTADLTWNNLDPSQIEAIPAVAKHFANHKAKQAEAKAARETFEDAMTAFLKDAGAIPAGQTARFGYNFGKTSFAVVPEARSTATRGTLDLSSLVKAADKGQPKARSGVGGAAK